MFLFSFNTSRKKLNSYHLRSVVNRPNPFLLVITSTVARPSGPEQTAMQYRNQVTEIRLRHVQLVHNWLERQKMARWWAGELMGGQAGFYGKDTVSSWIELGMAKRSLS